jgi:phosphoenolpyruvate carboxykinase (GTP)
MIARIHGDADARPTLLGWVPTPSGLDMSGLGMVDGTYDELFEIDDGAWKTEADEQVQFLRQFGPRLPDALLREHAALERRIGMVRSSSFVRGWRSTRRAATR